MSAGRDFCSAISAATASRRRKGRLASAIISDSRPTRSALAGTRLKLGTSVRVAALAMVDLPASTSKLVTGRAFSAMPTPVEALPCGSRSRISTFSPMAASAVPRLMAVVVLPTPPFWLAMARTRRPDVAARLTGSCLRYGLGLEIADHDHTGVGICAARDQLHVEIPHLFGGLQLLGGIAALHESPNCARRG